MTEDGQGRVTLREVYDLLAEFRQEVTDKFNELPKHYASIEAVNAHGQRISALEQTRTEYVPNSVHDLCRAQVTDISADLNREKDKREALAKQVWVIAGGAAVLGAVSGPIITHLLK